MRLRRFHLIVLLCGVGLVGWAWVGTGRLSGQQETVPYSAMADLNYVFRLELNGVATADYSECLGLGSSSDVEETIVESSTGVMAKKKTSGILEWPNITLKRTGPSNAGVWAWRKAMEDGNRTQAVREGAIVLYGAGSSLPLARWEFTKAWAARLTIEGSAEELAIAHDGLTRVTFTSSTTGGGGMGAVTR
jgi:phage tail-like protein